jgi:hypothetical protein
MLWYMMSHLQTSSRQQSHGVIDMMHISRMFTSQLAPPQQAAAVGPRLCWLPSIKCLLTMSPSVSRNRPQRCGTAPFQTHNPSLLPSPAGALHPWPDFVPRLFPFCQGSKRRWSMLPAFISICPWAASRWPAWLGTGGDCKCENFQDLFSSRTHTSNPVFS